MVLERRDEGGKVLRQYRSSALDPTQEALWIEDYVYRDGLLLGAERPATLGGRRHFHLDHLGSPRLITSNDGQIVSMHDYLPFGGETTSVWQEENGGFDREDPMKFTGHERDYAGGFGREDGHAIDYMHARNYFPSVGKFLSVDPIEGNTRAPQSWNRYTYVNNRPLTFTDPDGRQISISISVIAPPPVIDPLYVAEKERDFSLWMWSTVFYHAQESVRTVDRKVEHFEHLLAVGMRSQGVDCTSDADCADTFYQVSGVYNIDGIGGGVRTEAANLTEQLALAEAKSGAGEQIMATTIKDSRYPPTVWAKINASTEVPMARK